MYELKKIGKVFTSEFVGTGPSSYKKNNLPGRGLTKVEKHWSRQQFSHYTRVDTMRHALALCSRAESSVATVRLT